MKKSGKKLNLFLIVLLSMMKVTYFVWRINFTMPQNASLFIKIFWWVLLLMEMVGLFDMSVIFYNMYDYNDRQVKMPDLEDKDFPDVDVFVPSYNEGREILENTLRGAANMDYPDKSKVHVYLLDDGNRKEMENLCKEIGVGYITRKEHVNAKAGNINNALGVTSSPYIAIFDADMIPHKDFLLETIPYFKKNITGDDDTLINNLARGARKRSNGEIGFVQSPQHFSNPDIFQSNLYASSVICNEQDYFYRVIEPSRNKSNSVIFGGSNAVFYRKALEEVGGIVLGTITEDIATGMEVEKRGYLGFATNKILADGMTPDTFQGQIVQRRRWARGCIQTMKASHFAFTPDLTTAQKINYGVSFNYWYHPIRRLIFYLATIIFPLTGLAVVQCNARDALIFWLPMFILSTIVSVRFSNRISSNRISNLYEYVYTPYLLVDVILETLGFSKKKFVVTEKSSGPKMSSSFSMMIPYIISFCLLMVSTLRILWLSFFERTGSYAVLILWLSFGLYYAWMCIMASWPRKVEEENPEDLAEYIHLDHVCGESLRSFFKHLCEE